MNEMQKQMWMDVEKKIVSFHEIEGGIHYHSDESVFWDYIIDLTKIGYRIQ